VKAVQIQTAEQQKCESGANPSLGGWKYESHGNGNTVKNANPRAVEI
jgi:hypothetical protein